MLNFGSWLMFLTLCLRILPSFRFNVYISFPVSSPKHLLVMISNWILNDLKTHSWPVSICNIVNGNMLMPDCSCYVALVLPCSEAPVKVIDNLPSNLSIIHPWRKSTKENFPPSYLVLSSFKTDSITHFDNAKFL